MSRIVWGCSFMLLMATSCAAAVSPEDAEQRSDALLLNWTSIADTAAGGGSNHPGGAAGGPPVLGSLAAPSVSQWTTELRLSSIGFGQLLHIDSDQGGAWHNVGLGNGGYTKSNLASVAWGDDRLDLVTLLFTGQMVQVWRDGATNGLRNVGGSFTAPFPEHPQVAVATWAPGRLDLFSETQVPGNPSTSVLSHLWYEGAWGTWSSLGGTLSRRGLTAISTAARTLDVFAIWTDGAVHSIRYSGGWSSWSNLLAPPAGLSSSDIQAGNLLASAVDASGNVVVFTYDSSGHIYQRVAPFTSAWTLVDSSLGTVPGGLTAVRHAGGIDLFGWSTVAGDVVQSRIIE